MTKPARVATILGLVLGVGAAACTQRVDGESGSRNPEVEKQSERPIIDSNSVSRDVEAALGERDIVDRVRAPEPGLTIPPAFHGNWAPSQAECPGSDWVFIEAGGYWAPDFIAALLEPVRVVRQTAPNGDVASTIIARIEWVSDGGEGIGRVRMSRAGEHLYMSSAEVVGEDEHWQHRNVRCLRPAFSGDRAD